MDSADKTHVVHMGDSSLNPDFPPNKQETTWTRYITLLINVVWLELNNFYSLYLIILGILQCIPDMTDNDPLSTFLPLILVIAFSYLVQAIDFYKTTKSSRSGAKEDYFIIRDLVETKVKPSEILPGDIFLLTDQTPLPCDCLLLYTNLVSIFVDTSKIDGETDVKDKFPIIVHKQLTEDDILSCSGEIHATDPKIDTRDISGSLCIEKNDQEVVRRKRRSTKVEFESTSKIKFFRTPPPFTESDDSSSMESISSDGPPEDSQCIEDIISRIAKDPIDSDNEYDTSFYDSKTSSGSSVIANFSSANFVERGSVISSPGHHIFVALYTGKHCRSSLSQYHYIARRTVIDAYLEKLSLLSVTIQVLVAIIMASLGYVQEVYSNETYINKIVVTGNNHFWIFLVLFTRHFLLMSMLIPVTLKLILPVFRFIYGVFIANDINFQDANTNIGAQALSTNITDNLGSIDIVVADKTGTLTKNQLELISFVVGDHKYGDNSAASILEDKQLKAKFRKINEDNDLKHFLRSISICHSVRVIGDTIHGNSSDEVAIVKALLTLGWTWESPDPYHFIVNSPIGRYEYRVLKVNPFNRKRMRMSVIIEDEDGIWCYMKGAPERVVRKCTTYSGTEAVMFERYQQHGLRSLSVSYKKIDQFNPDEPLANYEFSHRFLGSLGIEDALQQDTQLSIGMLAEAGVKLWVATGDAHVNTLVTAASLKLVNPKDQVVKLGDDVLRNCDHFAEMAMKVPPDSFTAIVDCENGAVVVEALKSEAFVHSLLRGRCVIFYRCKPETKAEVVLALRAFGLRVLAVGDGANDTHLLHAADVGVGMIGYNGRTEVPACDFVIPAFRNLTRLILVHGHTSLHRSIVAVHFSFYKGTFITTIQLLYQIWTGFSGQSFFGSLSVLTFNILWTLFPMVAILFEKDVSENFLFRLAFLYKKLRNPLSIHPQNLSWLLAAIYQGCAILFVAFQLTGEAFVQESTGTDLGVDFLSMLCYFGVVITATINLMSQLNTLTYYSFIATAGNVILLVAFTALMQSNPEFIESGKEWYGFFGECFNSVSAIIILITMVLAAVVPSWLGLMLWSEFHLTETLLVIEKETIAAKEDIPLFFDPPNDQEK